MLLFSCDQFAFNSVTPQASKISFSGLSLVYRDLLLLYKIINRIHKFLIKLFTFIVDIVYLPSQSGELVSESQALGCSFCHDPWQLLASPSLLFPLRSFPLSHPPLTCCLFSSVVNEQLICSSVYKTISSSSFPDSKIYLLGDHFRLSLAVRKFNCVT